MTTTITSNDQTILILNTGSVVNDEAATLLVTFAAYHPTRGGLGIVEYPFERENYSQPSTQFYACLQVELTLYLAQGATTPKVWRELRYVTRKQRLGSLELRDMAATLERIETQIETQEMINGVPKTMREAVERLGRTEGIFNVLIPKAKTRIVTLDQGLDFLDAESERLTNLILADRLPAATPTA